MFMLNSKHFKLPRWLPRSSPTFAGKRNQKALCKPSVSRCLYQIKREIECPWRFRTTLIHCLFLKFSHLWFSGYWKVSRWGLDYYKYQLNYIRYLWVPTMSISNFQLRSTWTNTFLAVLSNPVTARRFRLLCQVWICIIIVKTVFWWN